MQNNWEKVSLGELQRKGLAHIQTGPFGTVLKASEYSAQGVPVISVGEIREGYIKIHAHTPMVSKEIVNRLPQFVLETGDIVFGRKGAINRNSLVNKEQSGWFLGSDGIRLRISSEINSVFVSYTFRAPAVGRWLLQNSSGSIMPSLNQKTLDRLPVWLPEKEVQDVVASLLSAIDKKIELNNRINAELEAMVKTLYDYWFVQFDFPDDSPQGQGKPYKSSGGKMVYNPTLKREIPQGWSDVELEEIIERSGTGLNPRDNFKLGFGSNYYVTIKNVINGKIVLDDKCDKIDDEALEIIDRRSQLQPGDVLFTSIQPVGVTYLIQEKPSNWNINESVFTLRANLGMATPEYLYMLLSSMEMKAFTKNSSSGSVHKGIRHGVLKSFRLAYGSKKVVDNFSQLIEPMLKRAHTLDKESSELVKLRDWLLPMLMNGQVTVGEVS